jgi:hypothetical protein
MLLLPNERKNCQRPGTRVLSFRFDIARKFASLLLACINFAVALLGRLTKSVKGRIFYPNRSLEPTLI